MPRFRFRLQPVLAQREREERDRMLVVADLERRRTAIESRIRDCQRRIEVGRLDLTVALSGGAADIGGARLQAAATLRDDQEARRAVLELAALLKSLEHARQELIRAAARRRAVELLRDRDLERFRSEAARRESHELDDLIVMRHRGTT